MEDVYISVDDPRVVPWRRYKEDIKCPSTLALYNSHRFPARMEELRFKTVWRAAETRRDAPSDDLFTRLSCLTTEPGIPRSLDEFEI